MGLKIIGEPRLNKWIKSHPLAERSLEVMFEFMPDMHIAWPMGPPFPGLVNLPRREIIYNPGLPDPVIVYNALPTTPKEEPVFVVGADGTVIDLADLENQATHISVEELRRRMRRMQEEG